MLSFACLNSPNFLVGNEPSFLPMLQTVHCFSVPKAEYVLVFPRKIFLHLLPMTNHSFLKEQYLSLKPKMIKWIWTDFILSLC